MNILLNLIFSFYPSALIFSLIPEVYIKKLNALAPTGSMHFVVHLIAFGIIFFIIYIGTKKFIFLGFGTSKRGILSIFIFTLFALMLLAITFWNILPGETIYQAPALINKYLLANPWKVIALALPFVYFFFD